MVLKCDILHSWKKKLNIVWNTIHILILVMPSGLSQEFVNCKFEYQTQLFDFNRLSSRLWNVSDIHDGTVNYILFSICNTTYLRPCGKVGFCVVMKDDSIWSSSKSNLVVQGDKENGDIRLSADLIRMHSIGSTELKLELKFKCSDEIGVPKFKEFKTGQLVLLWETIAACQLKNLNVYKNCIFEDEAMGAFNFQTLRHLTYYNTTNSKGSQFYVNVCGGTVGSSVCGNISDIAICVIDSEKKTNILGYASRERFIKNDLRLEYGSKKKHVRIELLCNSRVQHGELKLKYESNSSFIFDLETPLACINKLTSCFVHDKNHFTYNLFSLSAKDYVIVSNETKHKYIISVCKSVKSSYCSGGVSTCLQIGNSSVNLGTLKEGPRYEDDRLSISSSGGDYCNDSNLRYRSVILFECAKTDSFPSLVNTEKCVYTFVMQTPYACPSMFLEGGDCRVRDEDYGYDFDFNSLRKPNEDYIISDNNGGHFHLNLCGSLVKPCNGSTNVGVCLKDRRGTEHAIGEVAQSPRYADGHLSFVLNGELCKLNKTRTEVNIKFHCIHKVNTSYPEFVQKNDACSYSFVWYTAIACAQFTSHYCKVEDDNGEIYDLSPLSLYNDDYIVWHNKTNRHWKFVINVCQPIMFGNKARCISETAICMQNVSEPNYPKSFSSLGQASALQYDKIKKVLKLEYSGGGTCLDGTGEENFNSVDKHSTIIFICDRESLPLPKFIGHNSCHYEFEWRTKFACSKKMESNQENHKCKAFNSYSGVRVDLSSLTGQEYIVQYPLGRSVRFAVCGSLNNVSSAGIGICQETENGCENIGMGNSDLYYNTDSLYLNYTDGEICAANLKKFTVIEFKCDTKERQEITSLNSCGYSVSFFTSLACMVPCATDGPKQINLSFLSNKQNSYKTSADGVDYFISICKPLAPKGELHCDIGSAVCKVVSQGESRAEEVSLGIPHLRPALFGDSVILNYSSSQQCLNNLSQNVGSSIIFTCNPSLGVGAPVLRQILQSNCHYEFIWKTSVVCNDDLIQVTDAVSERMLNNSQNNMYIDLRPLCKIGKYKVGPFVINMCNQHSLCEIQKITEHTNISYGRAEYAIFNYSENKTKLFMTDGDECESSDKYQSSIHLLCSANSIEDDLRVLKETDCNIEFVWKSSSACGHVGSAALIDNTSVASRSSAGTIGVILGLVLAVVACLIVYCVRKCTRTNCCRRNINHYFHRRHEGEFHYTLVSRYYKES